MGLTWVDAAITTDALAADEVWITSAVRELIPVVAVDHHPIGDGSWYIRHRIEKGLPPGLPRECSNRCWILNPHLIPGPGTLPRRRNSRLHPLR